VGVGWNIYFSLYLFNMLCLCTFEKNGGGGGVGRSVVGSWDIVMVYYKMKKEKEIHLPTVSCS